MTMQGSRKMDESGVNLLGDKRRSQDADGKEYPFYRDAESYRREQTEQLARALAKMRAEGRADDLVHNHELATRRLIDDTTLHLKQREAQMRGQWDVIRALDEDPLMQAGLVHILPAESQPSAYAMLLAVQKQKKEGSGKLDATSTPPDAKFGLKKIASFALKPILG